MPHCPHTHKQRLAIASRLTELMDVVSEDSNRFLAVAKKIGAENLIEVLEEFGSEKIHAPTPESLVAGLARVYRDEQIRLQFDGSNADKLAITYSNVFELGPVSKARVLQIVNGTPRRYADKPAAFTSVKLHRDGAYELLKREAWARGGVPLHQVLAVIVEVGLKSPEVQAALGEVFGEQLVLEMGEQDEAA